MSQLSSSSTSWFRTGLPLLWLTAFGVTSIVLQFSESASSEMKIAFPVATVAGLGLLSLLAMPLKKVALEGDHLIVEGWRARAVIPLADVERVSWWMAVKPEIISIVLKKDSLFGRRILFTPGFRVLRLSEHPTTTPLSKFYEVSRMMPLRVKLVWQCGQVQRASASMSQRRTSGSEGRFF